LTAARRLAREAVQVQLIDRNNFHLFQPLLYQVATAGLEPEQIAKPVRAILRGQENLTFHMAEVQAIDANAGRVKLPSTTIEFDYLIVAVGAQTAYFGMQDIEQNGLSLKQLSDGVDIRNHILSRFERAAMVADPAARKALLTFVVVGGGPTGVEMAGALAELMHLVLLKDYPGLDSDQVTLMLLEMKDQLLAGFPQNLAQKAKSELEQKGVQVRLNTAIDSYDGEVAMTQRGEEIPAATLIWSAGVRANQLVDSLGSPLGRQGRVQVNEYLQLPGSPQIYVVGDAAYREAQAEPLPMMAPVAIQMAERAVDNILHQIKGVPAVAFTYRDPGSLATIGRNAAVASVKGLNFSGFVAWLVWLVVHLIQLIGFRNRLFVLVNWAWDYFFYDRAVRLITALPAEDAVG
jgi:NADH dehydrogenase